MKTNFPTISIDTRKKVPYTFAGMSLYNRLIPTPTQRRTLLTGDYSLAGFEKIFVIERKSILDFYRSITQARDRFEKEVSRMGNMTRAAVVVEGRLPEVLDPLKYGRRVSPDSILGTVASWYVRYGVPFFFLADRATERVCSLRFL